MMVIHTFLKYSFELQINIALFSPKMGETLKKGIIGFEGEMLLLDPRPGSFLLPQKSHQNHLFEAKLSTLYLWVYCIGEPLSDLLLTFRAPENCLVDSGPRKIKQKTAKGKPKIQSRSPGACLVRFLKNFLKLFLTYLGNENLNLIVEIWGKKITQ